MASNLLPIPFRRTHSVSLSDAMKQYISNKYDQQPNMFKEDLSLIDQLRSDAVTSLEAHSSGIRKLSAYAAQLVWIGGKFPIDIGVEFSWYPALGFNTQRPVSQHNLRFELANILFNLAALYSQLALALNRSTSEGLKAASNYFCQAAGVLVYLRNDIVPELGGTQPEDMDSITLESLEQLMLAQAQECSWSMAVKNGYKDALISRLAAKVSDFYDQATEFATRSDIISTDSIHHMTAKHHHFAAAAQYRAACDCLEKRKYGEEVARLRDSLACVNEALKESRWINKTVLGDLNGLKIKVAEDLKRAEKDNDIIYLMPVPPKSELKTLDRAGMAIARKPTEICDPATSLGDHGVFGQPLFARLVPYAVHVAASTYSGRKEVIVNNTIDELEGLTNKMRDLLQSLNLPGSLQALEKPLGLPLSIKSHAEEVRQQQGLHMLRRSMHDINSLKSNDVATYEEGVGLLRLEATENEKTMRKHGTERWTRPTSQQAGEKLYNQVGEIDGYLKSADNSDELVKTKLKECEDALKVLEGTERDLEEYVPSSRRAVMPAKVEREASRLRNVLNEVHQLESRRRRKIESLREKLKEDDINPVLLAETARLEREFPMQKIEPGQFETLFDKRLERYNDDRVMVSNEREDQDSITLRLQEADLAFVSVRRGDTSTREREQALQRLENAYQKYKEILVNLETGRKFYNELAIMVNRFRDECREFRYQRRTEAGQLEADLSNAMSALNIAQNNNLQEQKQRETLRSHYNVKAPNKDPMPAPIPQRAPVPPPPTQGTWTPEVGIKFGGPVPLPPNSGNLHNPTYPNTRGSQLRGSQWEPNAGIRFG
ncbi:pH-response regulator protein palA/rim20 [Ptychographa xylographoides]|nr:pH-response regulator protein palA/rim20 [Ptychographa xylographoides]